MASRLTTFIVVLIVTGTLVAGLIVGAQREDEDGPVDLIITNGQVFTGAGGALAEAVAVRGNKILKVGSNRDVKRLRRRQTVSIDAHGATVLAGFNDSHAHLILGGLGLKQLDLLNARTLDAIKDTVREYATANADRPWVLGRGWYYEPFGTSLPTRLLLDSLVADRPAFLTAYDGHTGWANSRALAAAGITRRTRDPKHGRIVRDARTGEPTGALVESAVALMDAVAPQPTREDRLQALRDAVSLAHSLGVTSAQDLDSSPEDFDLYDTLRRSGELDLRIYAAIGAEPGVTPAELERYSQLRKQFPDDPLLKAGAIKLYADGVVESYTAAMLAPYANRRTTGSANFTPLELSRIVTLLDKQGWQVMIHAIGDRAIRMSLDAFEHASSVNPAPERGRRHRIEHIETIDPADIPRFATLGVVASMQPDHGDPSPDLITVWKTNLGEPRDSHAWMYGSLLAAGAHIAFGSDWPVVSLDPRFGIHVAATRTAPNGLPEGGWIPSEKLALSDALRAYTAGGAWASFDEQRKGTLEPGMLADIVILTGDIFTDPPRALDSEVAVTIFDGRVVYERGSKPPATN
jgi:predicted amidohydrolase YtcJ